MPALVIDSNIVIMASTAGTWRRKRGWRYIAPPLMWSEVTSALHEATWRGELSAEEVQAARRTLADLPITPDHPVNLLDEAWQIADELGLAKTYDAEFLALARIRGCRLVTADAKLFRLAEATGLVVAPSDLG